ncbi:hypothetical protein GCM10022291_27260 [Postechiella marina]|uniref:DinB family protein n=1 Tax=Postechiella marina TaxID=943941 RepID=A0ABP8CEI4_9FLAO
MNIIIQSTLKTLEKTKCLLNNLSDDQLSNNSVLPYKSSIGSHIRHILDFYTCIFNYDKDFRVDLTKRSRNKKVECECYSAKCYLEEVINNLVGFCIEEDEINVKVIDDLGLGQIEILYSFSALLAQANSHTIHHYAIINYILKGLNIYFDDLEFGYNPTTPKEFLKVK